MAPETLDKLLTVMRNHAVRAASVPTEDGELRVEFSPTEPNELLDISPQVAGAWKRRAQSDELSPYVNLDQ